MLKRLGCVVCLIVCVASSESPGAARLLQTGSQLGVPQDPSAIGYLNLSKRHPDAADGPTEFASEYVDRWSHRMIFSDYRETTVAFERLASEPPTASVRGPAGLTPEWS